MTNPLRRPSLTWLSPALAIALCLTTRVAEAAPPDESSDAAASERPAPVDAVAPIEDVGEDTSADEAPPEDPPEPAVEAPSQPEPEPDADGGAVPLDEPMPEEDPVAAPSNIGPKHAIVYTSLLAPRINPLGLEERLWIGYQYRLYNKDKAILNGSNISLFFRPIVSPAIVLVGPTIQFQPAAVLRLRASYAYVYYFGSFQYMQSYQSPYDDYSETRLDAQSEAETNYAIGGHQVELEAMFQIKVKGLVVRNTLTGVYNSFDLRGNDDVFYAVRYDLLTAGRGWMLANDTDLLWLQDIKGPRKAQLLAGARATTLMPFFADEVYEAGDVKDNPVGPQLRIGPALGYIFYDKPDRRFNKPTLLLMPQWNVLHRYRSGRDVSTAYPTIVIAFVFSGTLWGKG